MSEFQRFAEFATMESHQNDIYFDRSAPWRAAKLKALALTDPTLLKAADDYSRIAARSYDAVLMRDGTYWTNEELRKSIDTQVSGSEEQKDFDIIKNIGKTYGKFQLLEAAKKIAFSTRVEHARLWDRVLASVKPAGGPERKDFPLRFGIGYGFWIRNVSGKPLTNLTVVLRTNSSKELPTGAALHVISFECLEPGEQVGLPDWLLSKLRDKTTGSYRPESNAFNCAVWSSEVQFEDVAFDLKELPSRSPDVAAAPNGWCKWACYPTADFKGTYDVKSPWPNSFYRERAAPIRGLWTGKDNKSNKEFELRIESVVGTNVLAVRHWEEGTGNEHKYWRMLFEGTVHGDQIDIERSVDDVSRPDFPTHFWGAIRGDKMELNYGNEPGNLGTISLQYVKPRQ